MRLLRWLDRVDVIDIRSLPVPFSVRRSREDTRSGAAYIGYAVYYVFGLRVARIQETRPWA